MSIISPSQSRRSSNVNVRGWATEGADKSSRRQLRDAQRKSGAMGDRRRFADILMAANAVKRKEAGLPGTLRDENGSYTLVGRSASRNRRVWLAGISAQRGY